MSEEKQEPVEKKKKKKSVARKKRVKKKRMEERLAGLILLVVTVFIGFVLWVSGEIRRGGVEEVERGFDGGVQQTEDVMIVR